MSPPSLEGTLLRTYLRSVVGLALATVLVAAASTTAVMIVRDDAQAVALARTLGTELRDEAGVTPAELDVMVAHELEEQRWFGRTLEVWRGARRIGGEGEADLLRRWATRHGCLLASPGGSLSRVCVVEVDSTTAVVVASPLRPLLLDALPVVGAIALSALLAAAFFATGARRRVRRGLGPLRAFERRLGSLEALEAQEIETRWGAREIDDLALAFDQLLGRIHAAVQQEQRFVANAAHELRTPLTRLRGQIDLVASRFEDDPESAQRMRLAARSCDELADAVDALLGLARDRLEVRETVDLGEIAADVVHALDPEEAARVRLDAEEAPARGDPRLLGLALRNLVDNALKYSDGAVRVRTGAGGDGSEARVLDEGPGIPTDELASVREAFARGSGAATRARGAGLGLPLADHVSRLHGGELRLETAEPSGLCAVLHLPAWVPEDRSDRE